MLIVGAGGLGCPAVFALAAAGVATLGVVDDDVVDATNLHRQILHGEPTSAYSRSSRSTHALERRFPRVRVTTHAARFDASNAVSLVGAYAVVVDGTDNFATKFVANDACVLARRAARARRRRAAWAASCSPCPPAASPATAACSRSRRPRASALVLRGRRARPVPGVIGALQGAEAARLLRGQNPAFAGRLVQYDSLGMTVRAVRFNPNPTCAVCGAAPRIHVLDAANYVERGLCTELLST